MNRSLPYNTNAEKSILAAMLMQNGDSISKIQDLLNVDDFFHSEHRLIYEAIMELYSKKILPDDITLCNYLQKVDKLEEIGGTNFIMSLNDVIPTTANIVQHAKIIKEKSTLRKLIKASEEILGDAYDDREDLDKILDEAEKKIFLVTARDTLGEFEHIRPIIGRVFKRINDIYETGGNGCSGMETGFKDFDKLTSGLQSSDLILIAARPSMGKTAFALNIAAQISLGDQKKDVILREGKNVAIFSLEMSKEQLGRRLISMVGNIESQKLNNGQLNDEEWNRLSQTVDIVSNAKLYIDDTPGLTVSEIRSRSRRLITMYGLDLIIIDYLQLMQGQKSRGIEGNRQQEISEISRSLKALARELKIPVIALSQLSRAVELRSEKKPQLSDLRESGSLEQDADIVMFLYRDEYYNPDTTEKNVTELIIAKHRNGPTGVVKMQFQKEIMRFGDYTDRGEGQ